MFLSKWLKKFFTLTYGIMKPIGRHYNKSPGESSKEISFVRSFSVTYLGLGAIYI